MRTQDKFFIRTAAAVVLILLLFSAYALVSQRSRCQASFLDRIEVANLTFRAAVGDAIRAGNHEEVRRFCKTLIANPIVGAVSIQDPAGEVWLDMPERKPEKVDSLWKETFSIAKNGEEWARVCILYVSPSSVKLLGPMVLALLGMIITMPLVLFWGYRSSSRSITRYLDVILGAMQKVHEGDYTTRLDLSGKGQFQGIGTYFNAMVSSIEISDRRESEHTRELEAKTHQLEAEIVDKEATAEALRQSQKMEAIARLAGGVAHDFNNLLTSILGFSTMALQELGEDHPASADIEEVVRSGERARDLTRKLLALGRKQQMDRRQLDMNVVIRGVVQLLKRSIGEDIELVTQMDEAIGSVLADVGSMEQVLMNLAVNARDSMPQGGRLYISSHDEHLDAEEALQVGDIPAGRYVAISVRDTGKGMSPDVRDRVFEPFFTTKGEGKGTGLGLSTAYGIINQCGGTMRVLSEPDGGSEFIVYLPTEGKDSSTVKVQLMEQPVGGTETVLLVEDEDSVRRLASRLLTGLGYQVLEGRYGAEGLNIARECEQKIDLILSDVVMPQISGPDMVEEILKHRSDFKVLYMSGFTQDRRLVDSQGREAPLLRKPFTQDQLGRAVRAALES